VAQQGGVVGGVVKKELRVMQLRVTKVVMGLKVIELRV